MNKYPVWWNNTVTLYNRYEDPLTQIVTWQKITLKNCFWKVNSNVSYSSDSLSNTFSNSIICRIPKNSKYVNPYQWKKLNTVSRNATFTLQIGDIVINGKIDDDIDESVKGKRSTDIISKYKDLGAIRIELISDNSDDARNIQHYIVSQGI